MTSALHRKPTPFHTLLTALNVFSLRSETKNKNTCLREHRSDKTQPRRQKPDNVKVSYSVQSFRQVHLTVDIRKLVCCALTLFTNPQNSITNHLTCSLVAATKSVQPAHHVTTSFTLFAHEGPVEHQ